MRLPRPHLPNASWLSPAIAAAAWWGVIAAVADQPPATQRSLVFLGGPLLLLAGLHARLFGFLHAPDRVRWLSLPIPARRHFDAALTSHRPMLGLTVLFGILALGLGGPDGYTTSGVPIRVGLLADFAWLVVLAGAIEPFVGGISAELGRRFPPDSSAHELQRNLGGGWTSPEAVIHLYAPAFGIGLATALAMPGQLSWERYLDTGRMSGGQLAIGLAPLVFAVALRALAPRLYQRGFWEAVPWLAEATRTLAGPPQPEPTPSWAGRIRDPWTRLVIIQFWRITPLPGLRLAMVLGVTVMGSLRDAPVSGSLLAMALAVIGVWLMPIAQLSRDRLARARLAAALPLGASIRSGRVGPVAIVMLTLPVLLSCGALTYRIAADGLADTRLTDEE